MQTLLVIAASSATLAAIAEGVALWWYKRKAGALLARATQAEWSTRALSLQVEALRGQLVKALSSLRASHEKEARHDERVAQSVRSPSDAASMFRDILRRGGKGSGGGSEG